MPNEEMWRSFFDPEKILIALGGEPNVRDAADFGCGYGTFAFPAAKMISGTLHGFDIRTGDDRGVRAPRAPKTKSITSGFTCATLSIKAPVWPTESVDYAMLFNILHTRGRSNY